MADELDPAVRRNEHGNYMVVTRPHFRGNGYLSCPAVPDPDPAWNTFEYCDGHAESRDRSIIQPPYTSDKFGGAPWGNP